jgi:hypothetical protein
VTTFDESYEKALVAAMGQRAVTVDFFSESHRREMTSNGQKKFATMVPAAREISSQFENRFSDYATVTRDGKTLGNIHRYNKFESRWYVGKPPAKLARYFRSE